MSKRQCLWSPSSIIETISLCPHCGKLLYSYNDLTVIDCVPIPTDPWSDGYSGTNSFGISRCPLCGCYFDKDSAKELLRREEEDKPEIMTVHSDDYDSVKEALQTLDFNLLPESRKKDVYLAFIHAFNTKYRRYNIDDDDDDYDDYDERYTTVKGILSMFPSRKDRQLFRFSVAKLIPLLNDEPLLQAELLRETGQYKRALIILEELKNAYDISPGRFNYIEDINVLMKLCRSRNNKPFITYKYHPQKDENIQTDENIIVRILKKFVFYEKINDRNHGPVKQPEKFQQDIVGECIDKPKSDYIDRWVCH